MKRLYYSKVYLSILFLFILLPALLYFVIQIKRDYIHHQTLIYTQAIKTHIEDLINTKKQSTLNLANMLSNDESVAVNIEKGDYSVLERVKRSLVGNSLDYKNIWVQYIDEKGISRYRSWSQKRDDSLVEVRRDIAKMLQEQHPNSESSISIGKFDLTFKGISPLYSLHGKFLGFIEIITHFNSIAVDLEHQDIQSAILVEERYKPQLTHAFTKKFIDDYYIANLGIKSYVMDIINRYGVKYLETIDEFKLLEGHYVIKLPIYNIYNDQIATFYAFIDSKKLERLDTLEMKASYLVYASVMIYLFLFILLLVVSHKASQYMKLIEQHNDTLQDEVMYQTLKVKESLYVDYLTGAYKRIKLDEEIRSLNSFTIIMLNIDNFSYINSYYGFSIGDQVLQKLVERLQHLTSNRIYRINGDEFVIIDKHYMELIETIKTNFIENPLEVGTLQFRLRFSFGVHITNQGMGAVRKATVALKEAKKLGKNRFVVYHEENLQERETFIRFNDILFHALEHDQIVPYFQGIYDNKTGTITKYEALVRIVNDDKVYAPHQFLNVAEVGGFLSDITKIMINKSLEFLQDNDLELSLNITEDDLQSAYLMDYLQKRCDASHIDTSRITLEILEGVSMSGTKNHIKQIKALKEYGFKIAIDDFGVEYSNFERIAQLDIDYIKIDGKYIKEIHTNEKYYKIVASIVYFAKSIGLEVVAEYVASQEIQDKVTELGIEFSQGYLFSEPEAKSF